MLRGDNLFFRWSRQGPWVLDGHTIEVPGGTITGLRGPSGSGKSTLAAVLAGLMRPSRGSVSIDDAPLKSFSGASPVQLVLQHPERAMNPRWTIAEVLAEALPGSRRAALAAVAGRVAEDWENHGLVSPDWLSRHPNEISGGELQRVNLARALFTEPRYLLADEISASLDAITQSVLWHRIDHEVTENGLGVLAVSHDTPLLERVVGHQGVTGQIQATDRSRAGTIIEFAPTGSVDVSE